MRLGGKYKGGVKGGMPMDGDAPRDGDVSRYSSIRDLDGSRARFLALKAELKGRLEQEQRNSRVNRLKIQNQWRKIMRLAKVDSLRKEIEILSQNHERDVDRKDAIIQMLDRDLEEAEDQFQMALRTHLINVDRLVDLQDGRLMAMEREFEEELESVEKEFRTEREMIVAQHASEVAHLTNIMTAIDIEEQERESDSRQEHEQLREEIRNKNLEEINVLRITLDTQIEDLEQHFETAHWNYLHNTDQRTTDFKNLTRKDQELSKEIEQKIRKIDRLQSNLQHWRMKISQNVKECALRNTSLLEEKNGIQNHFQHLKVRMNRFRDEQRSRLARLTLSANLSKELLKEKIALASRILTLAELGRKMETEQEKVAPFYASSVEGEIERQAGETTRRMRVENGGEAGEEGEDKVGALPTNPMHSSAWTQVGAPVGKWNHLDNFWKKYNKVLLDALAIEKEEGRLTGENGDLQEILKQYFDGISVNPQVMEGLNPLFVVNGKVNLNKPLPVRGKDTGHLTVVEANMVVRTNSIGKR